MEETLGKRIVSHRKRLGMTQDQLAECLGVTAQAVSKWENDQSCPDINILPQLADIFGISTDSLLGRSPTLPVLEAQVVEEDAEPDQGGIHIHKGNWNFSFDSGRKNAIWLAVFVLAVGTLFLLSGLLQWDLSFWDVLWPTSLLVFGLSGLFPRFSFFRLGCTLLGGYFLLSKLAVISLTPDSRVIFAVIILLFGLSLLFDALRKSKKPTWNMTYTDKNGEKHGKKYRSDLQTGENSFSFSASFGESQQEILLPLLERGDIDVSFGEYEIDLSGVEEVGKECYIHAKSAFGELTLMVPERFLVKSVNSTAFASFEVCGTPSQEPSGTIYLDANVNFGEIQVIYI